MQEIRTKHQVALSHHVHQGDAWLAQSSEGENTAALSYAALEYRFATERLAIHYWGTLLNGKVEDKDLKDIKSFKRVETRIYELGGHQREINAHFEFMRIVLKELKVNVPFETPQIGMLSNAWHECSELCHVAWPLASMVPDLRQKAFTTLTAISKLLTAQIGSLGWPILHEKEFEKLKEAFVAGTAKREEIIAHLKKIGVWARAEFPDGSASFVGEPIPPSAQEEPEDKTIKIK